MGQYYSPLVIDKSSNTKKLMSWPFDSGAKLMEHSWIGNSYVNAVYALIHNNPCKVAWIGDYSNNPYNPDDDAYARALPHDKFSEFFNLVWGENSKESLHPNDFTKEQLSLVNRKTSGMYIINHSRKCYLELGAYIQRATVESGDMKGWCTNPLPLLTACGNDRGNGDFDEGNIGHENIGIWAFDELEYSDKMPQGYTEEHFCFIERD